MLLPISVALYTVYEFIHGFDWQIALFRIATSIVLYWPSWYAAKQSNIHRKKEFNANKLELELASLNPYLETLPDAKKDEIKEKLVPKYFTGNEDSKS